MLPVLNTLCILFINHIFLISTWQVLTIQLYYCDRKLGDSSFLTTVKGTEITIELKTGQRAKWVNNVKTMMPFIFNCQATWLPKVQFCNFLINVRLARKVVSYTAAIWSRISKILNLPAISAIVINRIEQTLLLK